MADTDIKPHDPLALADDASKLLIEVYDARNILAQWAANILPAQVARQGALACLRSAREGIDELIAELGKGR